MKHLTVIQSEFIKQAFVKEARDWDDLTLEEQKSYIKRHPATKRKITAKPEKGSKIKDTIGKKRKQLKEESPEQKNLEESSSVSADDVLSTNNALNLRSNEKKLFASIPKEEHAQLIKDAVNAVNSDKLDEEQGGYPSRNWYDYDHKAIAYNKMSNAHRDLGDEQKANEFKQLANRAKLVNSLMTTFQLYSNSFNNPNSGDNEQQQQIAKSMSKKLGLDVEKREPKKMDLSHPSWGKPKEETKKVDVAQQNLEKPKKLTSNNNVNIANDIWEKTDKDVKNRLLKVCSITSSTFHSKELEEAYLNNSLADIYNAVDNKEIEIDNLPGLQSLHEDPGNIRDFAKVLIRYDKGDFSKYPLKGEEDYIKTGENSFWIRSRSSGR